MSTKFRIDTHPNQDASGGDLSPPLPASAAVTVQCVALQITDAQGHYAGEWKVLAVFPYATMMGSSDTQRVASAILAAYPQASFFPACILRVANC